MVWSSFLTFVTDTPDLTKLSANSPAVVLPIAMTYAVVIHTPLSHRNSIPLSVSRGEASISSR